MINAGHRPESAGLRIRAAALAYALLAGGPTAHAVGTPAGTVIENAATVSFDLAGTPTTVVTNTTTLTVVERIDVAVTRQSLQILVAASDTDRAILFTVTNTGNGSETFQLVVDNALGGGDFYPLAATTAIYFDSDASGDLTAGDQPYTAGSNDPDLAADASVDLLVVSDIPAAVANGDVGRSALVANAATGTGAAGTSFPGQGDGGVDAVVGSTGGSASEFGEYVVSDVQVSVQKSQAVSDPFGGNEPVPGATISYTITVEVAGSGTATASLLNDPIPAFSSFVPGSITLNGAPLTDAVGDDAGEFDTSVVPAIVVRLGDLALADGTQTVVFQVTID